MIKYLDEIETEFEITLACLSGAQVSLNHEQNWRSKIPLNLFQVHNQIRTFFPPDPDLAKKIRILPDPCKMHICICRYSIFYLLPSPPLTLSHTLSLSGECLLIQQFIATSHFTLHTLHTTADPPLFPPLEF